MTDASTELPPRGGSLHQLSTADRDRSVRFPIALFVVVLATFVFAACESVIPETSTQSGSFRVPLDYKLAVDTFNGTIEVIEGDTRSVSVVATIRQPDDVNYSAELDGNAVSVVATAVRTNISPSPGVSLVITAPPGAELDLRSSNGSIEVDGVGTNGLLESSNGKITLRNVTGKFVIDTSNGAITIVNTHGEIDGRTSNGPIEFSGSFDDGSTNSLRTSNGNITINVGEQANVHIDAETNNGDVDVEIPLDAATLSDGRVVGDIGDGSASLRLRTSNGSITIR